MLFITHEHVIRQAVNQTEGLDRRILPIILLGAYFPDIEKFPISRFYNEPTHNFPSKTNPLWHTQKGKAYSWGWKFHIMADLLWHEGIYDPMEYPICVSIGKYDPIRQKRMSLLEHMMREIALDFYVLERSGESNWGVLENLSLREIFHNRDVLSEFGFWFYRQVTRAYTRWFMPFLHVLSKRGKPRILARNYKLITEEITPSVNQLLVKAITATAQTLQRYLEVKQDMSRTSREHIE